MQIAKKAIGERESGRVGEKERRYITQIKQPNNLHKTKKQTNTITKQNHKTANKLSQTFNKTNKRNVSNENTELTKH